MSIVAFLVVSGWILLRVQSGSTPSIPSLAGRRKVVRALTSRAGVGSWHVPDELIRTG